MSVPKGYKYTEEQLALRKNRAKGKWSRLARERHSARMKTYWALKRQCNLPIAVTPENTTSVKARLDKIIVCLNDILKQIGG